MFMKVSWNPLADRYKCGFFMCHYSLSVVDKICIVIIGLYATLKMYQPNISNVVNNSGFSNFIIYLDYHLLDQDKSDQGIKLVEWQRKVEVASFGSIWGSRRRGCCNGKCESQAYKNNNFFFRETKKIKIKWWNTLWI